MGPLEKKKNRGPWVKTALNEKILKTTQPSYLHNLITFQPPRSTSSSSLVTLARPSTSSSLRITDRSFQYASPRLWNQLPAPLRHPRTILAHATISPFPTLPVLCVALPQSVPSTHHSHHQSPLIPGLEPSFSANHSHRVAFLFFFRTDSTDSPGLFTDTSEPIRFYFLVFLFFPL